MELYDQSNTSMHMDEYQTTQSMLINKWKLSFLIKNDKVTFYDLILFLVGIDIIFDYNSNLPLLIFR